MALIEKLQRQGRLKGHLPGTVPTSLSSNESRNRDIKASDRSTPLLEEMTFSPRANAKTPTLMTIKEQTENGTATISVAATPAPGVDRDAARAGEAAE